MHLARLVFRRGKGHGKRAGIDIDPAQLGVKLSKPVAALTGNSIADICAILGASFSILDVSGGSA